MIDITEEVIHHLSKNIKTEIAVSNIHGVGVFAIKDIKKGEQVFPNWEFDSGMYIVPNDRMKDIPDEVQILLHKYFINGECGFKILKLYKGLNFLFNSFSYCNSAYPIKENVNINNIGIALKDIKKGEEILEWYTENINLENSK